MIEESTDELRHWTRLWKTIHDRWAFPFSHPSFVLYFFVAVFLVGGSGLWLELHKYFFPVGPNPNLENLRTAVITFFPALAGSSCMQVILEENDDRALRALAVCVLIILTIMALAIAPSSITNFWALTLGMVGSVIALCTWWIANAKQPGLQDERIDAAVGKSDPKSALVGSLEGFKA